MRQLKYDDKIGWLHGWTTKTYSYFYGGSSGSQNEGLKTDTYAIVENSNREIELVEISKIKFVEELERR